MKTEGDRLRYFFPISGVLTFLTVGIAVWRLESSLELNAKYAFSIATDLSAIAVLTVFLGGCLFDRTEASGSSGELFSRFLFTIVRTLFYDFCIWVADGINAPFAIAVNVLANSLYSLANISAILVFADYLSSVLPTRKKKMRRYLLIVKIYHAILSILLLANLKHGFLFRVTDGVYHRGVLMPFLFISGGVLLLCLIRPVQEWGLDGISAYALLAYIVLPLVCAVMQLSFEGIGMVPIALFLSACILYVHDHIHRNWLFQKQTAEVERRKNRTICSKYYPQFVDNTLTMIAYLCRKNPKSAETLTRHFSKHMRASVDYLSAERDIPFADELGYTINYLEIEKIALGDRLRMRFQIGISDFELPILTLQALVENAVTHGIGKRKEGGIVTVSTDEDAHYIYVTVQDDGVGFDPKETFEEDGRPGLHDISMRLLRIGATLRVNSIPDEGTTVTVRIPKQRPDRLDPVPAAE